MFERYNKMKVNVSNSMWRSMKNFFNFDFSVRILNSKLIYYKTRISIRHFSVLCSKYSRNVSLGVLFLTTNLSNVKFIFLARECNNKTVWPQAALISLHSTCNKWHTYTIYHYLQCLQNLKRLEVQLWGYCKTYRHTWQPT